MHFLPVLGLMLDSLTTISVESHWCINLYYWPKDQSLSILRKNIENWRFWKTFFIPWKALKGFQPMRSWANTYAQDCTYFTATGTWPGCSCHIPTFWPLWSTVVEVNVPGCGNVGCFWCWKDLYEFWRSSLILLLKRILA